METLIQNAVLFQSYFNSHPLILFAIIAWSLAWKGLALWKSARFSHKHWFIAILVINTLGLLEIGYLFFVARKYKVEIEEI